MSLKNFNIRRLVIPRVTLITSKNPIMNMRFRSPRTLAYSILNCSMAHGQPFIAGPLSVGKSKYAAIHTEPIGASLFGVINDILDVDMCIYS